MTSPHVRRPAQFPRRGSSSREPGHPYKVGVTSWRQTWMETVRPFETGRFAPRI